MLLKLKKFNFSVSMFLESDNEYCDIQEPNSDKKTIVLKISDEEKVKNSILNFPSYIKILHNNKIGWINKAYVEDVI
jgi:hypothetical protein